MKKFLLIMGMFLTSSLFAQETALKSILKNVSIPNVITTIRDAQNLQKDLNTKNFTKLVTSWKSVEAIYFAGEIDNDYLDTPRYIDVFHNLKENLPKQMSRVIKSNDKVRTALFKNSFRTINALEYVLFNDETITTREKEISIEILNTIISNLEDINGVYSTYLNDKTKSEKWENALIINTLIASSYRLKEWRIGDPSGNSSKYKNDIKNSRAEYFLSKNSFNAIISILNAHDEIIGTQKYYNFETMASKSGAAKEIKESQVALEKSRSELSKLKTDDFTKAKDLFKAVKGLHNAYYLSLIEQLSVTAKILDADGD